MSAWTINLVDAWRSWVSRSIDDVDATRLEAWQDQPGPGLGGIRVAAGARVPAAVVNLVTNVRQVQTMNHLNQPRPTPTIRTPRQHTPLLRYLIHLTVGTIMLPSSE